MIIDNLASLPSTITTGDELPVERGTTTYKIDYNALAAAILARAALADYSYSGNIDNLFDTGMYYLASATGTGGIQDEGKLFGMLLVVKNGNSSRAVQLHVGLFTLGVEFRVYTGSWSEWKTLALTT